MAILESALPPQIEQYLDYFNRSDNDLTSCKAYYIGCEDKLIIALTATIYPLECKTLKIEIPVNNASIFCLQLDAKDFKDRIISTVLSLFLTL